MARPLRIEYPGGLYHVTSRGNARQPIFKDDEDRGRFLGILALVNRRYHWICHAYCLMNNHYHLVIETPEGNLARGMRQLNGVYTQSYNRRHRRVGHLLQGRYKAIVVDKDEYLLEVCRYVVLNPVRAKAVEKVQQWKWSSYRATAGLEKTKECLTVDWLLSQLSRKRDEACGKYRELVRDGIEGGRIYEKVRGQVLLGADSFVEAVGRSFEKREKLREVPRSQRYAARPKLEKILGTKKLGNGKTAREAVERYGYSQKEVADYLGLHYSTISRWLNRNVGNSRIKT